MVKSKFSLYVYFLLFFNLFFLVAVICFSIIHGVAPTEKSTLPPILGVLLILIIVLYFLYFLGKKVYYIKVDNTEIHIRGFFKKLTISETEIASINLFARGNYYWLIGLVTIATRIELTNGQIIIIADPFYRNIGKLKTAIAENFKEKTLPYKIEKKKKTYDTLIDNQLQKFAGNPFTSFNTVSLIAMVVFFFFLQFTPGKVNDTKLAGLLISIGLYFGLGLQMNYFLIDDKNLVVRNHYFFWYKKTYILDDIIAFSFETPYRRSEALRIVTSNFRSKLFGAGSLREKHWIKLRAKIEESDIAIVK